MTEHKSICIKCNQLKETSAFSFDKKYNKHIATCKLCVSIATRQWHKKLFESTNPTDILEATFCKMSQTSRSSAKIRKIAYTLSMQNLRDIYNQQNGKCFYTGVSMTLRSNNHLNRDPLLISMDRRDSTIGYTLENTVFCCWGVNALKGYHSENTLYTTLKLFHDNAKLLGKI